MSAEKAVLNERGRAEGPGRTIRNVAIADHLWEALELMAKEMGADRDALLNQAIFSFARLNGYVTPGRVGPTAAARPAEAPSPEPMNGKMGLAGRMTVPAGPLPPDDEPMESSEPKPDVEQLRQELEDEAAREPLEEGDELQTAGEPADAPDDEMQEAEAEEGFADAPADQPEEEPAEESAAEEEMEEPAEDRTPIHASKGSARELYVSVGGKGPVKVKGDRFLIGRGKHCDLVIESNRVSREHAVIFRQGQEMFIEDLKSSNGTWFGRERITKKRIDDGDELVLGTERVRCSFKAGGR